MHARIQLSLAAVIVFLCCGSSAQSDEDAQEDGFRPLDFGIRRDTVLKHDDGKELGSYNTQRHWLAHSVGPFLVYTRRGADNDHILRHRACADPGTRCHAGQLRRSRNQRARIVGHGVGRDME